MPGQSPWGATPTGEQHGGCTAPPLPRQEPQHGLVYNETVVRMAPCAPITNSRKGHQSDGWHWLAQESASAVERTSVWAWRVASVSGKNPCQHIGYGMASSCMTQRIGA